MRLNMAEEGELRWIGGCRMRKRCIVVAVTRF